MRVLVMIMAMSFSTESTVNFADEKAGRRHFLVHCVQEGLERARVYAMACVDLTVEVLPVMSQFGKALFFVCRVFGSGKWR